MIWNKVTKSVHALMFGQMRVAQIVRRGPGWRAEILLPFNGRQVNDVRFVSQDAAQAYAEKCATEWIDVTGLSALIRIAEADNQEARDLGRHYRTEFAGSIGVET